MSTNGETVTAKEAAAIIGVDLRTVREWVADGQLKSIKGANGRRRILRSAIGSLRSNSRPLNPKLPNLVDRHIYGYKVPKGFDLIETYKELAEYTTAFANRSLTFLLLVGLPGSGKTKQIKADLAKLEHRWIDNHASELGLYCAAYKANHSPIVLDDVNHFLEKPIACSLMKALTQTEQTRSISWESTTSTLDKQKVPRQFSTSSSICLIGNKWDGSDPDMAAIQDRALPVAFYPSAEAIHDRVRELGWCDKAVWKFIGKHLAKIPEPSMREYHNGMGYKKAGMQWEKKLMKVWESQ